VDKAVQAVRDEAKDVYDRIKARTTEKTKEKAARDKALGSTSKARHQRKIDSLERENTKDRGKLKELRAKQNKLGQAKSRKDIKDIQGSKDIPPGKTSASDVLSD
jgi:cell shape-determining protein MreC